MRALATVLCFLLLVPAAVADTLPRCTDVEEVSLCTIDENDASGSCETIGSEYGATLILVTVGEHATVLFMGMHQCGGYHTDEYDVRTDVDFVIAGAGVPAAQTYVVVYWLSIDTVHPAGDSSSCTFLVMVGTPAGEFQEDPGCLAGGPPARPWGHIVP